MAGLRQQVVPTSHWNDIQDRASAPHSEAQSRLASPWRRPEQRLDRLARTIELEVIPRLVLARRAVAPEQRLEAPIAPLIPSTQEIAEFAGIVLGRSGPAASSYVEALRGRGLTSEALYLDLLAPTARHLGDLWTEDLRSFAEVTLALLRLHQVMHELSPTFQAEIEHHEPDLRALLVPAPGEQHFFGVAMVTEFFRRAGWSVAGGPVATVDDLAGLVRRTRFAVVGISVACDSDLDVLVASIRAVRRESRNPAVGVMVGGPTFVQHPELVRLVGADTTAVDGRQAVLQAHSLLDLLASRR